MTDTHRPPLDAVDGTPILTFDTRATIQLSDEDIQNLSTSATGLPLEKAAFQDGSVTPICDVSTRQPRPVVPAGWFLSPFTSSSTQFGSPQSSLVGP
ncbi:hypothetical protein GOODEAATRI_024224 [Goodea atripinnis]|uniref:Uncharacterized protein n=1 Tax=Goodea atripinnis TaxID=208336 RepID=A0ABV0N3W9_9TELE